MKKIVDTSPLPEWFDNSDKQMFSPNGFYRLVYYHLNEIRMGSPLFGDCYLESEDGLKIQIHHNCGGPPVWETSGQLVAVPIWTEQRQQKMAVVNVITKELTIFQELFPILHLLSFDKNVISAKGRPASFDIRKERVERVVRLGERVVP